MQNVKYWIEKTIVEGRPDRLNGDRALGKALWSPQKSKSGADIYINMRLVKENDVVLHLIDNKHIVGASKVKEKAVNAEGLKGTEWEDPAYLIKLKDFIKFEKPIERNLIFDNKYKDKLLKIENEAEVFYTSTLELRQGAYLTECPLELLEIINKIYLKNSAMQLPYLDTFFSNENQKNIFGPFDICLKGNKLIFDEMIIKRFIALLLTKPFVILTGLSGSGKTKLAQAFATWICEDKNQFCLLPVGADWTNREPLLGYPSALEPVKYVKPDNGVLDLLIEARKEDNKNKPYFLILDEMNLSHVERYFADFLSAMESGEDVFLHSKDEITNPEKKIKLPDNLFIIGTVNIDETTYMFSPKVLDRAGVIEFRVSETDMQNFLKDFNSSTKTVLKAITGQGAGMAGDFLAIARNNIISDFSDNGKIKEELNEFFKELKTAGAEFGYRTATDILLYASKIRQLETAEDAKKWAVEQIIDTAVMQKLLPKLHGSKSKLKPVLEKLAALCLDDKTKNNLDLNNKETRAAKDKSIAVIYKISFEKICRMYDRLISDGFTSYAEA